MVLDPNVYKALLRPLLFLLPAESAQRVADVALRRWTSWEALSNHLVVSDERLHVDWCGHTLSNPIGLAAGFDKTCELLPALAALGFGYVVGGTVTAQAKSGHPKPRLVRNTSDKSLVNAMGFPNEGAKVSALSLEQSRINLTGTPVVVSIAGSQILDVLTCHTLLEPIVDVIEINISSPNTAGLKIFQEPSMLEELIERVNEQRIKPLIVKLPPYSHLNTEVSRDLTLTLAKSCNSRGVNGLTLANSRPVTDDRLSVGSGGLSGKPVFEDMLRLVRDVRSEVGNRITINACGGIFTGGDAWEAMKSGANTVQLYTGLIYNGPGVVRAVNQELIKIMDKEGINSLT